MMIFDPTIEHRLNQFRHVFIVFRNRIMNLTSQLQITFVNHKSCGGPNAQTAHSPLKDAFITVPLDTMQMRIMTLGSYVFRTNPHKVS